MQSKITLTCPNLPTLPGSCVYSGVITAFPINSFQPPSPPRPCVGPGMFIHLQRALLPKGVSVLCLVFRARGTAFLLGTFVAYPAVSVRDSGVVLHSSIRFEIFHHFPSLPRETFSPTWSPFLPSLIVTPVEEKRVFFYFGFAPTHQEQCSTVKGSDEQ